MFRIGQFLIIMHLGYTCFWLCVFILCVPRKVLGKFIGCGIDVAMVLQIVTLVLSTLASSTVHRHGLVPQWVGAPMGYLHWGVALVLHRVGTLRWFVVFVPGHLCGAFLRLERQLSGWMVPGQLAVPGHRC